MSDSADYVLLRTRTKCRERGFCYSGPAAWNSLLLYLLNVTDNNTFQKWLIAYLQLLYDTPGCYKFYIDSLGRCTTNFISNSK